MNPNLKVTDFATAWGGAYLESTLIPRFFSSAYYVELLLLTASVRQQDA